MLFGPCGRLVTRPEDALGILILGRQSVNSAGVVRRTGKINNEMFDSPILSDPSRARSPEPSAVYRGPMGANAAYDSCVPIAAIAASLEIPTCFKMSELGSDSALNSATSMCRGSTSSLCNCLANPVALVKMRWSAADVAMSVESGIGSAFGGKMRSSLTKTAVDCY
jgi:hypothetical protein